MANVNKVILIGNLTRDPELRHTPSGMPIAEFGLAVNRRWKDQQGQQREEVMFVDVSAWGKTGELAKQYLAKGRQVYVEGHLKLDQWTSPDGQKRSKHTVVVDNLQFLDARGGSPDGGPGGGGPSGGGYAGSQGGGGGYSSRGPNQGQGRGRPAPGPVPGPPPQDDYGDINQDRGGDYSMGDGPNDDIPF